MFMVCTSCGNPQLFTILISHVTHSQGGSWFWVIVSFEKPFSLQSELENQRDDSISTAISIKQVIFEWLNYLDWRNTINISNTSLKSQWQIFFPGRPSSQSMVSAMQVEYFLKFSLLFKVKTNVMYRDTYNFRNLYVEIK